MKKFQTLFGAFALTFLLATMGCSFGDPCKKVDCVNGECVDGNCACEPGYSGADCSTFDPCYNVNCVNGNCVNGNCDCDNGYEGADCSQAYNAKFSGTYLLTETCSSSGGGSYAVIVAPKSGSITQAYVTGFWYEPQGITLLELVNNSSTSFIINRQQFSSNFEIECPSGSISADGNIITLAYNIYVNGNYAETCTAQLTK